jgi:2-oxopent-4-enoate hydratase
MTDQETIQSVAKELRTAEESRRPVAPVAARFGDLTVADAYAVQLANLELRLSAGEQVVGYKIGLTSLAMQAQLGVDQPDYGHLLSSMGVADGDTIATAELIAPRIELEIAFVLRRDLQGPDVTGAEVLDATEAVFPSLEIIDSRVADWKIGLVDTVADNASSGRFLLPSRLTAVRDLDLRLLGGIMEVNGELTSLICGAAALGDPLAAVAWLANALSAYGGRLEAGSIVLSGALDKSVPVKAGDVVRAEFDRLGSTTVHFG